MFGFRFDQYGTRFKITLFIQTNKFARYSNIMASMIFFLETKEFNGNTSLITMYDWYLKIIKSF